MRKSGRQKENVENNRDRQKNRKKIKTDRQ